MKYEVRVKEVKKYRVDVEAENEEEALKLAQKNYSEFRDNAYSIDIDYYEAVPKKLTIECGKTMEEYMANFGEEYENGELWDFSAEDINGGAVDPDPDILYWEIDGRIYETTWTKRNDKINKI